MWLWKVDIQKISLSKCFVDYKNLIVSASILLFIEKLYLDDPYNKIFTRSSSQCCMINIGVCSLHIILCIQVGIKRFSQYFLFFLFSLNMEMEFLHLLILKFSCFVYCIFLVTKTYCQTLSVSVNQWKCERRLEEKKKRYIWELKSLSQYNAY